MLSLMLSLLVPSASAWTYADREFSSTITRVEQMVWDQNIQGMAARQGLGVMNVTWEDTGRYQGSSVGPNISDMTIGVRDPSGALHPMPVVRFDNFSDKTADVQTDGFWLRVGNEHGASLRTVSLAQFLQSPRSYLHNAASWAGYGRSLWADRDSHVLVSAQACFLPIPQQGSAPFTPVLYNYQSYPGNPAVLTITATREGTSTQVVENSGGYLSEVLTFNQNGMRAPFTAARFSDWQAQTGSNMTESQAQDAGLNVVLVIQVPLKQKAPPPQSYYGYGYEEAESAAAAPMAMKSAADNDVENAVIGHGPVEGPFKEVGGLSIERDTRFPVRVTVQFYKATSNGVVSEADMRAIRAEIDRVYSRGDYVGSLVVGGSTGRPTEWGNPTPPPQTEPDARWADSYWSWMKAW